MEIDERVEKMIRLVEQNRTEGETFDQALDFLIEHVTNRRDGKRRAWMMGHPLPP